MARRIQRGDMVVVTSGADKGRTAKVLRTDPRGNRIWVEGMAMQYKHVRRSQQNPKGGRVHREGPIHISNVALCSEKTGVGQRFRVERSESGSVRIGAKDGQKLD